MAPSAPARPRQQRNSMQNLGRENPSPQSWPQPPNPAALKANGAPPVDAPEPPLSPRSVNSDYGQPDPKVVAQAVQDMMKNVADLKDAFDSFQGRKTGVMHLPPPTDIASQVRSLRKNLIKQDSQQEARVNELTEALKNDFTKEVVGRLRMQLERMVREEVAKRIKDRVAAELERQFPKELADKIRLHQKQMKSVNLALHNSEARRANAGIRSTNLDEPLMPLWTPECVPSPLFPQTLAAFFTMPEPVCQNLLQDYGLPITEGEPRDKLLNRIMSFIGVTFSIVPGPTAFTLA